MTSGNRRTFLALLIAFFLVLGLASPSAGAATDARRAKKVFKHASTCGDWDTHAYQPGKSNKAMSVALVGHYAHDDSGCGSEFAYGRWISDTRKARVTFRWMLGQTVIRKHSYKRCGTARGCRDLLQWKHKFTINDSGVRYYNGKRLTVRVTFSAPNFKKKNLRTNPAYDSGYYAHLAY